jgi:release factor glutamine methyltransferase
MTIKAALLSAKEILTGANIESASLDAEILLSYTLRINRSHIILLFDNAIDDKTLSIYKKYITRRAGGVCTAYITGKKEFRYLDLSVNKNVLVPRPETETLVEAALEYIDREENKTKKIKVLDLCTGCGAIALSLLYERPFIEVTASDISGAALSAAKKNFQHYSEKNKMLCAAHFIQSDLFQNIDETFDIIVSNPPYIETEKIKTLSREVRNEPRLALDGGADGLSIIQKIIVDAKKHLYPGGTLLLEADGAQMESITKLLTEAGYDSIVIKKDLAEVDRIIGATQIPPARKSPLSK